MRYEFTPTGKTTAEGKLFVNGQQVGSKSYNLPTVLFTTWEGIDVGRDALSHVSEAYKDRGDFPFPNGELKDVHLEIKLPSALAGLRTQAGGQ